jgi:hypothetical protein
MEPKVHYYVHNIPPLVTFLRQINPVHMLTAYSFTIHLLLPILLCANLPSGLIPSAFLIETLYVFPIYPIYAGYKLKIFNIRYKISMKTEDVSASSPCCN